MPPTRADGLSPSCSSSALAWLVFLPNAPYVLTDFIHLGAEHRQFDAILLASFAFTSLALGFASLLLVQLVVTRAAGAAIGWFVALSSILAASVGIYLGRVLRLNSWDVVQRPGHLAEIVLARLEDPFGNRSADRLRDPRLRLPDACVLRVLRCSPHLPRRRAGTAAEAGARVESLVAKPVEQLDSVVIRFAGDSGDGMQLTGGRFTSETAMAGNDLATFPDFPAEIRAPAGSLPGVSGFQLHFADHDILTPGDQPDVLVAMNRRR